LLPAAAEAKVRVSRVRMKKREQEKRGSREESEE
jgi:hypothetical protein